ncbi:MAG TPA: J domain-containing protein [Anaerolineae bacterium]|nr:J domain-containing protein [Anaerolineae bacterium]
MPTADLQREVEARRAQAARLEQERVDLQVEIEAFRLAYLSHAGAAQAELQALEIHIAEYQLRNELMRLRGKFLSASQLEAEVDWQMRRRREEFTAYQDSVFRAERETSQPPPAPDPATQNDLKSLYRDLAKRAHPDLATDDAERASRGALMVEINAAYRRSDLTALKAIFARSSDSGQEVPDDMERLRAEITRLDGLISKIRAEIADLNRSDWMTMKLDAALARARGIDWFELARRQTEMRAAERRAELDDLIVEFMDRVRSAGLA